MAQSKTNYRAWRPGFPSVDGTFLIANRGESGPENLMIVRAVSAGPRTLLLDLQTGDDADVSALGDENVFSYSLPKITERAQS